MEEKNISEKESLDLIASMIQKAKNVYYDTGWSAILWGSVVAFCSLVKFAELQFDFNLPFDIYWLTVLAIVPQVLINVRENRSKKVRSYDDIYMYYIWLGFGISVGLMILIVNAMGATWQPVAHDYLKNFIKPAGFQLYEYIAPLFLVLYGLPTFITGAACKFKPMLWGGLLCWACCVITVFTEVRIDLLLIAVSSIFAWLIPGILMLKDHRIAKKESMKADV